MEEALSRIDRDMASDRKDIGEWKIELSSVKESIKENTIMLSRLQVKTKDGIKDAIADTIEPMQDQLDQFVNKKVLTKSVPVITLKGMWEMLTSRLRR